MFAAVRFRLALVLAATCMCLLSCDDGGDTHDGSPSTQHGHTTDEASSARQRSVPEYYGIYLVATDGSMTRLDNRKELADVTDAAVTVLVYDRSVAQQAPPIELRRHILPPPINATEITSLRTGSALDDLGEQIFTSAESTDKEHWRQQLQVNVRPHKESNEVVVAVPSVDLKPGLYGLRVGGARVAFWIQQADARSILDAQLRATIEEDPRMAIRQMTLMTKLYGEKLYSSEVLTEAVATLLRTEGGIAGSIRIHEKLVAADLQVSENGIVGINEEAGLCFLDMDTGTASAIAGVPDQRAIYGRYAIQARNGTAYAVTPKGLYSWSTHLNADGYPEPLTKLTSGNFTCVAVAPSGRSVLAVGNDNVLFHDGKQVHHNISFDGVCFLHNGNRSPQLSSRGVLIR